MSELCEHIQELLEVIESNQMSIGDEDEQGVDVHCGICDETHFLTLVEIDSDEEEEFEDRGEQLLDDVYQL